MLQLPDFDEKQIIFIESFDTKNINFENENLTIKEEGIIKNKISLFKIFAIFLIGETTITSVLIRKFQEYGITLVMMKKNFTPYLVIGNETEGNYVLRKKQYEKTEEEMLEIAKSIIKLKTHNQLELLKAIREKDLDIKGDITKINGIITKIDSVDNYESLLGYEGNVSKLFFTNYFKKIGWYKRAPRTKMDIKNLLLDIGYTYLFHFIEALLRLYGFDNYYGVYHRTWYARKSLALDLMEPFRCIIDKAVLKAYNLGQINEKDFKFQNGQYILPWENSRKYNAIFFKELLSYKKEMFIFIKDYYKYFMKGRNEFPKFKINE
ncbi:MAG: type V CRISPR-associated endonuclease Cas1 [Candidatus Gracilibacteria bacterium]|nr:type V CRISPR-associated endonuclease Cas1 [Candidatus Gracilibacteria bacterium]